MFAAIGKVVANSLFWDYFSAFVNCVLVLKADWVYLSKFEGSGAVDRDRDAVS